MSVSEGQVGSVTASLGDISRIARAKIWVTATPARLFWGFAAIHLVLWTVVPALTSPNAPLDVIEGYAWGHEWLIGTHKHPPMQAWWLEILAMLTNRAPWVHFFASQLAIVIAFWAVWRTGRRMFSPQAALLGALLLEGVVYYNFTSPEFNPNVLQLPFWALTGLYFHRAVKEGRMTDWFLLGLFSAGGLYSKYSTMLLLVSLTILLLVRPEGRRRLAEPGPWIALLTVFALFLPHIIWLIDNSFLPFTYAWGRMHDPSNIGFIASTVRAPVFYILSQLLAILPMTLLFFAFFDHGKLVPNERFRSFDRDFLDFVTFGPFIFTLIMAVVVGIKVHDMWAMPFWNFIGLWAISRFKADFSPRAVRRFTYSWVVVSFGLLIAFTASNLFSPYFTHRGLRVHFPGQALAATVGTVWHDRFRTPVPYVVGDVWAAGNVAYYLPEWPHVLIKGDYEISPWLTRADVRKAGAIIVWCMQDCAYKNRDYEEAQPPFVKDFPQAEIQEPIILSRQTDAVVPPAKIGWAIIPPTN